MKKYIQNSKSWNDLNNTLSKFTKSNQSKLAGDIFEYLTKLYLETAPQYKTKLKKVYLLNEVPTTLKKKINLPDTDEGIDLIAVTNDDEYWAIQCKYRSDPNQTLTIKEDLATFNNLAFTYCKNISHGIVCATVSKPPKKIKLLKSIGFETLETWLALDDNDLFSQIKAKASGKVIKPKPLSPRPHQVAAIKKTIDHFKSNERGKIIMPCGTGKSLTAFWIAKKMGVKSILVAVPSLALLQQTLKVWTREFLINGIEPEWFCVCSDGTVKDDQDDYVTDTSDLGIKVDTDPKLIKQFLRKKTSKIKVLFTTYQSGRATSKGSRGFTYDLGIMDEAHKTVGSKTKEMAHLLHQKNVKIKKRISMTATERLFRGDSDEFMSMDDPRDYGDLIYELSFKEAINSKPPIISDYKIITFGITVPEIEEIYNSNKYLEVKKVLKDITARELTTALALRKAIKKFKINNAISFHRSIRRADNFRTQQDLITKIFPEYGKLKSFHVAGDMPTADRAVQMREFAKGKGLMTNARCLTEGVDLPAIDCVCFTDPKRSKVDIVQAAGRALRLAKGKKFGYILIPIFIPAGADFNDAAEEQGFDDVAITVRSLATTDIRIVEYLRAISEGKKPRGGSPVDGITSANSLLKIEAEEFDNAIKLKIWDKVAAVNYKTYEEASDLVKKLKIQTAKEFYKWTRTDSRPKDIPYNVQLIYKNKGWISWGHFFGTGRQHNKDYREYNLAKKFVKKLKLKKQLDWINYTKKNRLPNDIPKYPQESYKNKGWVNWGDFLDHHNVYHGEYLSYEKSKKIVRKLKLQTKLEWYKYASTKKPVNIPYNPDRDLKDWINWQDFLGYKFIPVNLRKFVKYEETKKFANKKKIKSLNEWYKLYKEKKMPVKYPRSLITIYKKQWEGAGIFFNTGKIGPFTKNYVSFKKLRNIFVKMGLKNRYEYSDYIKKNNKSFIYPQGPDRVYKKAGWKGWSDFLGNIPLIREYVDINLTKKYMIKNNIKSSTEWFNFIRKKGRNFPLNIPKKPHLTYKNKWKGWEDFLGKKK